MWTFKSLNEWLFHSCVESFCFEEKNQAVTIGKQIIEKKPESCFVFLYFLFCHSVPSVPAPSFVLCKLKTEKRGKKAQFFSFRAQWGEEGEKKKKKSSVLNSPWGQRWHSGVNIYQLHGNMSRVK